MYVFSIPSTRSSPSSVPELVSVTYPDRARILLTFPILLLIVGAVLEKSVWNCHLWVKSIGTVQIYGHQSIPFPSFFRQMICHRSTGSVDGTASYQLIDDGNYSPR